MPDSERPDLISAYELFCASVAVYPGAGDRDVPQIIYTLLGLNGEAGEAADHAKKMLRDDDGILTPERRDAILKEVGDSLWYVTRAAAELGSSLTEMMDQNIAKLTQRQKDSTLHGDNESRVRDYEKKQQATQLLLERLLDTLRRCDTREEMLEVLNQYE